MIPLRVKVQLFTDHCWSIVMDITIASVPIKLKYGLYENVVDNHIDLI